MIDPACLVSADGGIDHFCFVVESEIICPRIVQVLRNIRPQNTAAGVFDDKRAFAEGPGGENAAAVHCRFAYFQVGRDAVLGSGGARPCSVLLLFSLRHKMNSKFVRKAELRDVKCKLAISSSSRSRLRCSGGRLGCRLCRQRRGGTRSDPRSLSERRCHRPPEVILLSYPSARRIIFRSPR